VPRIAVLVVNNSSDFYVLTKIQMNGIYNMFFRLVKPDNSPHWPHTVAETFVLTIGNSKLEYFSSTHSCSIIMMNSHIIT
jgi:hypothetical protein